VIVVPVITIGCSGMLAVSLDVAGSPPVGTAAMRSATSIPVVTLPNIE
jgi:hypothetical protein